MADLDAIARGLAANLTVLRTSRVVGQVTPYPLVNPSPPTLQVAGVAAIEYDEHGFGITGEDTWTVLIEAVLGNVSQVAAQTLLYRLLSESSVKTAVESDIKLTSRLSDDGSTVATGQPAAAVWLKCRRYRGQSVGGDLLYATWEVEVAA